ncbi:hypothetical protein P280DRAFT_506812 [Massarina eburnea CBS 473.64]|uniref:Uncharacterized protein n=1 Tax=Massarina eburnea CBS 473.64 TaxID=1395130 RepID=A0A6A6S289_9PLEO|nr:hypothetical protein P280DRAFT_506812 [Massarina eburnea CBS 473.64]
MGSVAPKYVVDFKPCAHIVNISTIWTVLELTRHDHIVMLILMPHAIGIKVPIELIPETTSTLLANLAAGPTFTSRWASMYNVTEYAFNDYWKSSLLHDNAHTIARLYTWAEIFRLVATADVLLDERMRACAFAAIRAKGRKVHYNIKDMFTRGELELAYSITEPSDALRDEVVEAALRSKGLIGVMGGPGMFLNDVAEKLESWADARRDAQTQLLLEQGEEWEQKRERLSQSGVKEDQVVAKAPFLTKLHASSKMHTDIVPTDQVLLPAMNLETSPHDVSIDGVEPKDQLTRVFTDTTNKPTSPESVQEHETYDDYSETFSDMENGGVKVEEVAHPEKKRSKSAKKAEEQKEDKQVKMEPEHHVVQMLTQLAVEQSTLPPTVQSLAEERPDEANELHFVQIQAQAKKNRKKRGKKNKGKGNSTLLSGIDDDAEELGISSESGLHSDEQSYGGCDESVEATPTILEYAPEQAVQSFEPRPAPSKSRHMLHAATSKKLESKLGSSLVAHENGSGWVVTLPFRIASQQKQQSLPSNPPPAAPLLAVESAPLPEEGSSSSTPGSAALLQSPPQMRTKPQAQSQSPTIGRYPSRPEGAGLSDGSRVRQILKPRSRLGHLTTLTSIKPSFALMSKHTTVRLAPKFDPWNLPSEQEQRGSADDQDPNIVARSTKTQGGKYSKSVLDGKNLMPRHRTNVSAQLQDLHEDTRLVTCRQSTLPSTVEMLTLDPEKNFRKGWWRRTG